MLKEKIQFDMKEAMKSGNAVKRMVLSLLQSAVKNKELEKRAKFSKISSEANKLEELSRMSDEEVVDVTLSEAKKRKESIESYEKAGRDELAKKEKDELAILMEYLPEQMSEDEIRSEAKKAIDGTGAKDIKEMGKVLGVLMSKVKGRADGQTVSRIVKDELSK